MLPSQADSRWYYVAPCRIEICLSTLSTAKTAGLRLHKAAILAVLRLNKSADRSGGQFGW
jgi:hypothetical protein